MTTVIQGHVTDVVESGSSGLSGTIRGVSGAIVTIDGYSDTGSGTANASGHYAFDVSASVSRSGVDLEFKTRTLLVVADGYRSLSKSVVVSGNATVNAYLLKSFIY